uniref:IS66 family transposase n=1 Tax=Sedimentitalea todarodis TaxID=1631240 RepID=UPI002930FDC1|nr:transposase [Sedimentitalea todarodis]
MRWRAQAARRRRDRRVGIRPRPFCGETDRAAAHDLHLLRSFCAGRTALAPDHPRPITCGRPGPGLLAHVLVGKYCDHLPLYRQSEIYARDKVDLHRSTLTDH